MSATERNYDPENLHNHIDSVLGGSDTHAEKVHAALTEGFGLPRTVIEQGGRVGVPTSAIKRKHAENPAFVEERYGHRNAFLLAALAGREFDVDNATNATQRAIRDVVTHEVEIDGETRNLVDETVVGDAAPVEVDPVIVDVQRSAAPELDVIQTVSQAGFEFRYNIIDDRDDPVGFLSETEAAGDLEDQFDAQSFNVETETASPVRHIGLFKVSDFTQRAMESLEYMDPRETTLGQGVIAHTLQKAKGLFYGDTSVNAGDNSVEDDNAFDGLAKIAEDAGNDEDKSTVSSGFLEDLLDELTDATLNTGLTWDRARFLVSQPMYNAIYEEATPVIRLDGYDADVEFGPQGIQLSTEYGTAPITPAPNIREYADLTGVGDNSGEGDVFLIDELAVQFRQLAPMSTVPLGRTGLADRVAMFEYYTLIDRSHGNHTYWFQGYDI